MAFKLFVLLINTLLPIFPALYAIGTRPERSFIEPLPIVVALLIAHALLLLFGWKRLGYTRRQRETEALMLAVLAFIPLATYHWVLAGGSFPFSTQIAAYCIGQIVWMVSIDFAPDWVGRVRQRKAEERALSGRQKTESREETVKREHGKKKKSIGNKFLILLLLLLFPAFLQAQQKGYKAEFTVGCDAGSLNAVKDVYMLGFTVAPGYAFNERFSLSGECTVDMALLKERSYQSECSLGIAGQYAFLLREKGALSARLSAGHTIFADRWKHCFIDGGIRYRIGRLRYAPVAGVGIRWYGASGGYVPNYCSVYVCLGFRFN